jgi:hypothetical protein
MMLVAHYQYGPFGEVLRATGPMAKANPFRFSTKYQMMRRTCFIMGIAIIAPRREGG